MGVVHAEKLRPSPADAELMRQVAIFARKRIRQLADENPDGIFVERAYEIVRKDVKKSFDEDLYSWSCFESDLYWMAGD